MSVTELEIRVISKDDLLKSVSSSARRIAKEIGANVKTCQQYLQSYRLGYISRDEYARTSFISRRITFCDPKSFEEEYNKKGYIEKHDEFEIKEKVSIMLNKLPKKEREVIRARYFMYQTYEAIGKNLGLTKQRIHQIEKKALARLRCTASEMQLGVL